MPADRLGVGTAAYRLLTEEDLPTAWLEPISPEYLEEVAVRMEVRKVVATTLVELPDYPWAWHYERWSRGAIEAAKLRGEKPLGVMLVSRSDFRALPTEAARSEQAAEVLRSLLQTGRPLPLFSRTFGPPP